MVYIPEEKSEEETEKLATKAQRHKVDWLLKFIFLFWRLDGENVWTQNVIDRPLEDSKIITKGLSFFRDDTRNKSP
jgi:hypothetical protein